ncbi:MAG: orotidine-5'-phosphate decarboxylase [Ignavibacteria bacterium]|nr:orotidine-5'-phosphate decarboxylase [Ignavibacteria bacterium]
MPFLSKLDAVTTKNKSLVCVGLDTDPAKIPAHLRTEVNPVLAFNRAIIEATADVVQSYKLNLAFYEALGPDAHETIRLTLDAIPTDIVTIGDGKRGDIGNTSAMYAAALFDGFGFDAVTVAPYMGYDSVQPFLAHKDKGVFILTLTSNKGSRDFQYLEVEGRPLYAHVLDRILEWNEAGNCGLVVGATHPSELAAIRATAGDMPILIPGLGAQGGDVEQSVRAGVTPAGLRGVFNSSRGILYASGERDFAARAREAAIALRDEINAALPSA